MKEYIENAYRLAVLDFKAARTEEERWAARRTLARLEYICAEKFGFEFTDELRRRYL